MVAAVDKRLVLLGALWWTMACSSGASPANAQRAQAAGGAQASAGADDSVAGGGFGGAGGSVAQGGVGTAGGFAGAGRGLGEAGHGFGGAGGSVATGGVVAAGGYPDVDPNEAGPKIGKPGCGFETAAFCDTFEAPATK